MDPLIFYLLNAGHPTLKKRRRRPAPGERPPGPKQASMLISQDLNPRSSRRRHAVPAPDAEMPPRPAGAAASPENEISPDATGATMPPIPGSRLP